MQFRLVIRLALRNKYTMSRLLRCYAVSFSGRDELLVTGRGECYTELKVQRRRCCRHANCYTIIISHKQRLSCPDNPAVIATGVDYAYIFIYTYMCV